ncbi:Large exoprotein involved in heme utilization or adhesion [Nostoc flagelliforme CCNUN1]|uniref:Large exoprotein involved in heme utilization or adhesion n=1 Tax=Nostoc flagelliforme CCNUN1 TaxID=2038116 RepID=A0A2K8SUT8_9NOSO|nr:filamentous hemagglutinin N-terminal domain-containing protein [Nostoc flagelliforme]AUB39229.1 Large exoprotein involved in heme utilization or adhesion [Nostoc flagelliforme CCNUN1]
MSGLGFTRWGALVTIALGVSFCTIDYAIAQITPDGTLPNNTSVTREGNTFNITGGTQAGGNLFHSFGEFSVNTGGTASFNNALDIQNIISRVTGGSVSNINGIISTKGTANLFLINPNGIIFGQNAQLNIGGSFVASTANALQFGNRGFFSATEQNTPSPLLTINPSALLFNQINQNAVIQNSSVAFAGKDPAGFDAFGLRVPDGKSLLLVGGNVSMDGGELNAYGGQVELGGLGEPGTVGLGVDGDNLSLRFLENVARTEISLTNQARIYVEGAGGGNIAVYARNLDILEGSILSAGIGEGLGTSETVAGDITLNATREIKVAGESRVRNLVRLGSKGNGGNITIDSGDFSLGDRAQLSASTFGQGNGGNITIDSGSFSLQDGTALIASTYGRGNAGNLTVRALDAVTLADNAGIVSIVEAGGVGKGGNIDINAATLSLIDGATLQTLTREASDGQIAGRGDAGNVNVNVTGKVDIAGRKNGFASGITSQVNTGTQGNGGNITIDSGSFSLRDGAGLQASTFGQGNAGNVTVRARDAVTLADADIFSAVEAGGVGKGGNIDINAATLSLIDGAVLVTATREASDGQIAGRGDAGNVNVNVTGKVDIAGEKNGFPSGIFSFVNPGTQGNGGNITINSGSFSLRDRAKLETSTFGQGNAGTIKVNAADFFTISGKSSDISSGLFVNSQSPTGTAGDIIVTSPRVTLDNGGIFNAESASGNGGDINLQTDLLLLRRGAQISTTAGTAEAGGDGGNINIDVPSGFIVAVPNENSDIAANAFSGTGGRVNIKANGIYGIQFRENPTLLSDITASSEFGTQGTVELNTPGIDPNSGLVELPTIAVETEVAQVCDSPGYAQSSFIITGRGGLPPNPTKDVLPNGTVEVGWVSLKSSSDANWRRYANGGLRQSSNPPVTTKAVTPTPERIVEASGWAVNKKGEVVLTANLSAGGRGSWHKDVPCSATHAHQ